MDWKLFFSTFGLIVLAELPDKTALAILLLAAKHSAIPVFLGAAGAFVVQCLVAVLFGSVISLMPAVYVHRIAGVLFLVFALMMWREHPEESELVETEEKRFRNSFWGTAATAFMVVFIAEWGDLTQLATATLQARYHKPFTIFLSSTLALWTVTAFGAAVGHHSKKIIRPERLKKVGAVIFGIVGIYFLTKI